MVRDTGKRALEKHEVNNPTDKNTKDQEQRDEVLRDLVYGNVNMRGGAGSKGGFKGKLQETFSKSRREAKKAGEEAAKEHARQVSKVNKAYDGFAAEAKKQFDPVLTDAYNEGIQNWNHGLGGMSSEDAFANYNNLKAGADAKINSDLEHIKNQRTLALQNVERRRMGLEPLPLGNEASPEGAAGSSQHGGDHAASGFQVSASGAMAGHESTDVQSNPQASSSVESFYRSQYYYGGDPTSGE